MNQDDPARLARLDDYRWSYDDYRPSGKGFNVQGEWLESRVQRYDFPYTLGEATIRVWKKAGIDPRSLFDEIRAGHAQIHRASRAVTALKDAAWPTYHTATLLSSRLARTH